MAGSEDEEKDQAFAFAPKERVYAKSNGILYRATIKKRRRRPPGAGQDDERDHAEYFVHYSGFKGNEDAWLPEGLLNKLGEEAEQLSRSPPADDGGDSDGGKRKKRNMIDQEVAAAAAAAASSDWKDPSGSASCISAGYVDFPRGAIKANLTCFLCQGIYRDPHTIIECLHTFCKGCITMRFYSNKEDKECPICQANLAPEPLKEFMPDRIIESIVDKVFPELREADQKAEVEFYHGRGIALKERGAEGNQEASAAESASGPAPVKSSDVGSGSGSGSATASLPVPSDEMNFRVTPNPKAPLDLSLPPLALSSLRASGQLRIRSIKKLLCAKLAAAHHRPPSAIEVCCNGDPVGDELSLTFLRRTRLVNRREDVALTYQLAKQEMF